MQKLEALLQDNGIDPSTLQLLVQIVDSSRVYISDSEESLTSTTTEQVLNYYYLTVSGSQAFSTWQKLRVLVEETGYWPVILGGLTEFENIMEYQLNSNFSPAALIEASKTINAPEWFENEYSNMFDEPDDYDELHADWPETNDSLTDLVKFWNEADTADKPVYIALVPTGISWQVPAYLNFGNWNACPEPQVHTAVMRYYQELYQTEIVVMSNDVIELKVGKPVTDRKTALILAKETYPYCPDSIDQGAGSLEALAATFMASTFWFFWWD
ncbi:MAG TPA: DUF4253 domain-containing protein [Chloroflexia bacterium]|nr:DUF4253 domain-containing protein [Chloroflexia bacterium]